MQIQGRESGLALIVTLLLGLIAAGFIGAMMYALGTGSRVSGIDARYTSSLQAAKGGASYITQNVGAPSNPLKCEDDGGNTCDCDYLEVKANGEELKCPISSNSHFAQSVDVEMGSTAHLGDYDVEANLSSMVKKPPVYIFTFNLMATTDDTEERSEIEFVYKIE